MVDVHPSHLAGTWYPGDARALRKAVESLLAEVAEEPEERLRALIAPHAGYQYSGRAAGAAYAHVPPKRWRRAALLAPSHYHSFRGGAIFPGSGFETPLGVVQIDREAVARLAGFPGFFLAAAPYAREHSLEIQLPFLQVIDPELLVVPVLIGADLGQLPELAPGLEAIDDGQTLFVVSSDFTHYGASFDYLPFLPSGAREVAERLRELDFGAIDAVCRLDVRGFEDYVRATGITICGRAPIAAFLHSRPRDLAGRVAAYYTSLDVTGDYEHSVSYAAILFTPAAGTA